MDNNPNTSNMHSVGKKNKKPMKRKRRSPYSFLPLRWSRGSFLKWLRRTHAWLGLWGAALGILFGITGILLNHRSKLQINAAHTEQTEHELTLPQQKPENIEEFALWLKTELNIDKEWSRIRSQKPREISWDGKSVTQPARWSVSFSNPKGGYSADYWVGNTYTTVRHFNRNIFAFLNRLHKASGLGVGWILLADTIAGSLIILSLSGILLWTRLHGPRLLAASLGIGSICMAIYFVWRAF